MELTIITNYQARPIIHGWELTDAEREEFDYLDAEELEWATFVRYQGALIHIEDTMRVEENSPLRMGGWQGYVSETFFSGIVLRYQGDESVVVGRYMA